MNWAVELSASAIKELKKLPRARQAQIERTIDEMESDSMAGDVIPLKSPAWKARYRKRVGLTGLSSPWTARLRPWPSPPFSSVPKKRIGKRRSSADALRGWTGWRFVVSQVSRSRPGAPSLPVDGRWPGFVVSHPFRKRREKDGAPNPVWQESVKISPGAKLTIVYGCFSSSPFALLCRFRRRCPHCPAEARRA